MNESMQRKVANRIMDGWIMDGKRSTRKKRKGAACNNAPLVNGSHGELSLECLLQTAGCRGGLPRTRREDQAVLADFFFQNFRSFAPFPAPSFPPAASISAGRDAINMFASHHFVQGASDLRLAGPLLFSEHNPFWVMT